MNDVIFVGGYRADQVRARYPGLRIVVPADWENSGSAASLFSVPLEVGAGAVVAYSDILIRPEAAAQVRDDGGDIVALWDSLWRQRYAGRRLSDLKSREKVCFLGQNLVRSGIDISTEEASGEFVGLVRLASSAVDRLSEQKNVLSSTLSRQANMSELIELLLTFDLRATGVDAAGDWAEVNDPMDVARFILGTKADSLSRLGRVVQKSRIADQVTHTVSDWESDPHTLVEKVTARFGPRPLIVRSSTTHEDACSASNAGGFTSVLGVQGNELPESVARVANSYRGAGIDARNQQVLVQPLIERVVASGVALTRTLDCGAPWIVIEYSESDDTEAVTSGSSGDLRTIYIRRASLRGPDAAQPTALNVLSSETVGLFGLLDAVQEVEQLLGHDALDIEFALDDTSSVHLLQVRPAVIATVAERRDEEFNAAISAAHEAWAAHADAPEHIPGKARLVLGIMPDWNPAEIIGTAPRRLALDLYRQLVTDSVWAEQRAQAGYLDVRPSPLLIDIAGRPYVDVRASFASFLPAGLDESFAARLLAAGLDRLAAHPHLHDKVEFSVVPTCVDPDWQRWQVLLSEDGFSPQEITELHGALSKVTGRILSRVEADLETLRGLATATTRRLKATSAPLERAAVLLDEAALRGTLPFAHLARAAFVAVSLLRGAQAQGILSDLAVEGFHATIHTVSQDLAAEAAAVADGRRDWTAFVQRWGHLRPGTYEITSDRYDSDVERFLRPLIDAAAPLTNEDAARDEALTAWAREREAFAEKCISIGICMDAATLETALRSAIEGREWAKLAFTKNLSDALEAIALGWEHRGVSRDVISDAPLSLLLPDATGDVASATHIRDAAALGRSRRELAEATPLPPLLRSAQELDVFVLGRDVPNFVGLRPVVAPAVELNDSKVDFPPLEGRIVLIPRADPGFDWIFGHGIAGLVTLYGGANSHMAIRAAEHGLAAAIGVGEQRYRELFDSVEIEIDPRGQTLRALR